MIRFLAAVPSRAAILAALCLPLLAACGGGSSSGSNPPVPEGGEGRVFRIQPGADATTAMIGAMIQALPGDVIEFGCGYFELDSALQLTNTEDVTIRGCGRDATVLSFKTSNTPEGILAVNVHGLWIEDLTVLDTGGNGIELRGVDHARIQRVRALWSSGGGRESPNPITAANAFANDAALLKVACTDPPTLNPDAPENQLPGLDTTSPDYTVSPKSGRYGIYPVASENILVDEVESVGASDAGIYVGQTNNAIIRNSRAAYNVFGFEIENVQGGEYANNIAECNTGGFLIYDLDGLRQYGDRSRMYGNISRNNNTYNFTSGGIVGSVPPGSGMITLSYDRIEIFDNLFENNNTAGIIHTSYELFPEGAGRPVEKRIDWYSEGVYIHGNRFVNNGNGLPRPTTTDLANGEVARVLPALVGLKNAAACLNPLNLATCLSASAGGGAGLQALGYRGAHIIWDGLLDVYDADCPYPVDASGNPVPADARGKPLHTNDHPNPPCHYNAYKFDTAAANAPRIVPDWFASCIDDNNEFSDDSLKFARFNGTKGLEVVIAAATANPASGPDALVQVLGGLAATDLANFASSFDTSAHSCQSAYGRNLQPLPPVVIPPFERSGDFDPAPSEAQVKQLCEAAVSGDAANFAAAAVNCPTLDQYALFSDPEDPTSAPRGGGVPFVLNTRLFSDYALKYRVAYLPPGTTAIYRDGTTDGANAAINFPVGTIIAKTFSFADDSAGTETAMETRLLIKRRNSRGLERWDGVPYIWTTENGRRVARLAMGGGLRPASWRYTDVDSGVLQTGSTGAYQIPHANQCLSCHANEDADTGSAPIGPRIRNMNRPYASESSQVTAQSMHAVKGRNQIAYWCENGLMSGCPSNLGVDPQTQIAAAVERLPVFNKPGDAGFPAGSPQDIEARARAYLEVNCQYCHNPRGFAGSTGLYLDVFRAVNESYGVCKRPTATGQEGNGGRTYDIHPGNVGDSIMPFRIGPTATTPAARMPPLARSVVHAEGHALVEQWIRDVIVKDESKYPGSTSCSGG
jgi:uncharacterized repeat protein (TIGR03806 family)